MTSRPLVKLSAINIKVTNLNEFIKFIEKLGFNAYSTSCQHDRVCISIRLIQNDLTLCFHEFFNEAEKQKQIWFSIEVFEDENKEEGEEKEEDDDDDQYNHNNVYKELESRGIEYTNLPKELKGFILSSIAQFEDPDKNEWTLVEPFCFE